MPTGNKCQWLAGTALKATRHKYILEANTREGVWNKTTADVDIRASHQKHLKVKSKELRERGNERMNDFTNNFKITHKPA